MKRMVCGISFCMLCSLMTTSSVYPHFVNDFDKLFDDMERDLQLMHERAQDSFKNMQCVMVDADDKVCSTRVDMKATDVQISKDGDNIVLTAQLGDKVKEEDIDVRVESGALLVSVPSADNFELRIRGKNVTISASKVVEQEKKDDKGMAYLTSSGAAQISRSMYLPAPVKIDEKNVSADFTNGVLTLTFPSVPVGYKVPLTSGNLSAQASQDLIPKEDSKAGKAGTYKTGRKQVSGLNPGSKAYRADEK